MLVKIKDFPRLKDVIKAAFPRYRKHSIVVNFTDKVWLSGGYWDGGSRTEWEGLNLNTRRSFRLSYPTAPACFGGGETPTAEVGNGKAVVQGGISCGKPAMLGIYLTKQDWDILNKPFSGESK